MSLKQLYPFPFAKGRINKKNKKRENDPLFFSFHSRAVLARDLPPLPHYINTHLPMTKTRVTTKEKQTKKAKSKTDTGYYLDNLMKQSVQSTRAGVRGYETLYPSFLAKNFSRTVTVGLIFFFSSQRPLFNNFTNRAIYIHNINKLNKQLYIQYH
jgi:hypothetical protein